MGRLDDDDGEFGGYFDGGGGGGRADRDHLGEARSDTGPASRGETGRDGALKASPSRRGEASRAKRAEAARALLDLAEGRVRLSAPVGPGQPNYPDDARKAVRVAGLFGATGVRDLQGRLNRDHLADIGPPALKEDGVFGPVTLAASERAAARRIAAARKKAETDRKRAVTSAQARTRPPTRRPDPGRPDLNLPKQGGLLGHPEPKPEPKPAPHPNRRDPTRAMLETLKRTARTEAERQTLNVIAAELSTIERQEREDERKRRADVEAALGQRIGPDKAARAARSLFGEEDSSGLFYGEEGDDRLVSGEADDRLGAEGGSTATHDVRPPPPDARDKRVDRLNRIPEEKRLTEVRSQVQQRLDEYYEKNPGEENSLVQTLQEMLEHNPEKARDLLLIIDNLNPLRVAK